MAHSSASLLLILLAAGAATAQVRSQLPIEVEARSSDFDYRAGKLVFDAVTITQGDVRIVAERAQATGLDFQDSQWEFSGTVRISFNGGGLDSDRAEVRFQRGEIAHAQVRGSPALFRQQRGTERAEGRAERIDYDLGRGTVRLVGQAWLSDGRNEITGSSLVYSTANQRVIARSAEQGGEPVRITIQPSPPATPGQLPDPAP